MRPELEFKFFRLGLECNLNIHLEHQINESLIGTNTQIDKHRFVKTFHLHVSSRGWNHPLPQQNKLSESEQSRIVAQKIYYFIKNTKFINVKTELGLNISIQSVI